MFWCLESMFFEHEIEKVPDRWTAGFEDGRVSMFDK